MEQQDNILTQIIKEQVPVPVIGDDNKPAEPVKPVAPKIESEADIDARLTQMLMDEAKADKERDEKRLQRQMAARSLSDMGGVIIDLVKGSEGARVDPRHTEQHYQKLDDQTRKVYDAYRTRVDLLRKQKADRDKARIAQAAADAQLERQRRWQLEDAATNRKNKLEDDATSRAHQLELERIRANKASGSGNKSEDKYFIDFGNGETKDYKNNTKEGMNAYAAIFQYLLSNGYIPKEALQDKDGNIVPIKTQAQADLLVRMYLPTAMSNLTAKSAIYKIVMGKDKDFRDPLLLNIEESAAQRKKNEEKSYLFFPFLGEEGSLNGGSSSINQTSSGSLY